MTIAIFRVDDEQEWMYSEILDGRLRQGWGAPEFSLVDQNGKQVSKEKWETTYNQIWEEPPSPRRYSILSRMLQLNVEDVDIVVVPKVPHPDQFTIARVSGGYQFDRNGNQLPPDCRDYRHVVDIDPSSVRTFHYRANDESFLISGLFSLACHRSAVSFNHDSRHRYAIEQLLKRESKEQGQDTDQLFETIISASFKEASLSLKEQAKGWNGQKFEGFVRRAFREQGYTVSKDHPRYDGQGADCDILVSLPPSRYDIFLPRSRSEEIAVQVKWKQGIDHNDVEALQQIIKWTDLYGNPAMIKCVISSAEDFTCNAKELAEENEVLLVCGLQTMCFLLGIADRYRVEWC